MQRSNASFLTPPPPIEAREIIKTINTELVVVGAGLGGLSTAVRAKELGVSVLLIEKAPTFSGRGGHFGVAWSELMEKEGIINDRKELARQWIAMSGNNIDEELLWTFINRSGEAMNWFIPKAEAAGLQPRLIDCRYNTVPYTEFFGAHAFPPTGGIRGNHVSRALFEASQRLGLDILFETAGHMLIKEDGRVTGIIAKSKDGYIKINASEGVALATGDIGGDEEMCKAYAPDALMTLGSQYVPVGMNTGDGHKMGLWAGAAMAEEVFPIMMHPQHYTWMNLFFLFVNSRGRRFMNEDTYVQGRATAFMRQPGGIAWSILDSGWREKTKESLKYGGGIFWGNAAQRMGGEWTPDSAETAIQTALKNGLAFEAETIEELAEKTGIPKEAFLATVGRYNEICEKGYDTDFGKRSELLYPIKKAPFTALKMGTVLLEVVGGLAIDTKMRVLDKNKEPIPGLYAVGDTTGGLYGHEYVTTILGNSHGRALTWGYIAAESVAEKRQTRKK